ncbi:AraC-like DNA-binding protein [Pseudoduganella flava]|uniref:AraC-like DNA-binding protein n=1 Tax=Pseudoduganella flava TaxID=871742 RepID=A0A562PZ03_9BURK|nr:AraC family transcriptional regulator [Pseudoduganella flava]QGZ38757.1 helix-turn-helix domain-containing protein [Pseudoduganella flava]TWI49665.1 AraC-like DNA-binding protein [Pseudoduganella flava]
MTTVLFEHASAAGTTPRVAGSYLQPLLETAAARGVDAAALAAQAGLPAGALAPLPDHLPADAYPGLLDAGAALTGDPHFGLHVGERVRPGTYTVYGMILLSCRDIGQVFEQTLRYEALAHDLGRSTLTVDGAEAHYRWHSAGAPHRHLIDSVFAGIRVFGNWLTGADLPANALELVHDGGDPAGHAEYVRVFGTLPRFGAAGNAARFDAALLALPVPNADTSLYPLLRQHADELLRLRQVPAVTAQVRAALTANLAHGGAKLAAIATQLAVTPRTLQRKLADAGTSFQQVLDGVRFDLARGYLARPELSLVDIAFLLGYGEQSAFSHAFRDWAGVTPGAYREALRCPASVS